MRPSRPRCSERARALAAEIDLELAWEFAPDADFGFADLARDYFDAKADAVQQAAMLLGLFEAPHYFSASARACSTRQPRDGAGRAAGDRAQAGAGGPGRRLGRRADRGPLPGADPRRSCTASCSSPTRTPPNTRPSSRPRGARSARRSTCCARPAPSTSPYQFHWRRFLYEQFPRGTGFADAPLPDVAGELPLADAQAFSIDDSSTTEIDDALSVHGLGSGTVVLGIHIAAPALAIAAGLGARPHRARAPVHGLHAGPQDHDAARRRGAALHAERRPRLRRR